MADHRIRVIIEGVSQLTPGLKQARRQLDEFTRYVRNEYRDLNKAKGEGGRFISREDARAAGLLGKTLKDDFRQAGRSIRDGVRDALDSSREIQRLVQEAASKHNEEMKRIDLDRLDAEHKLRRERLDLLKQAAEAADKENAERVKNIQRLKNMQLDVTDAQRKAAIRAIEDEIVERRRALEDEMNDRQAAERELIDKLREERNSMTAKDRRERPGRFGGLKEQIEDRERALRREREDEKRALEAELKARMAQAKAIARDDKAELEKQIQAELKANRDVLRDRELSARKINDDNRHAVMEEINIRRETAKRNIEAAPVQARQAFFASRSADIANLERFDRALVRTSNRVTDFTRGLRAGAGGLDGWGPAARRAEAGTARLGHAIGRTATGFGELVNIRWALMFSLLGTLITLLGTLGSSLLAVAASAVQAGAALGGAFAAGLAQALPVLGLIAGGLKNLGAAQEVVKLRQSAKDAATQEALLGTATKATTNAMQAQTQAVKDLAAARVTAAKAIRDAALDERDAELSVKEAQLDLLEARQKLKAMDDRDRGGSGGIEQLRAEVREAESRLRLAQSRGDNEGILQTQQALAAARSNLSGAMAGDDDDEDPRRRRLAVERAEINLERARNRRTDARQENARRQREGVEGSPEVIAAKQRLAAASQGVAAATNAMSAAAANAQIAFDKLSPATQRQVIALEKLMKVWEEVSPTFLDPITDGITSLIQEIIKMLQDPEIQKALKDLGTSIGAGFKEIARFLGSKAARDSMLLFIREATKNMPVLVDLFKDLLRIFLNMSAEGQNLFGKLLGRFAHFVSVIEDAFRPANELDKTLGGIGDRINNVKEDSPFSRFLRKAADQLDSWIHLATAIGNVFLAFADSGAAEEGQSLIDDFADALDRIATWIEEHPEEVREFFEGMTDALRDLVPSIKVMGRELVRLSKSEGFRNLTKFFLEVFLPAIFKALEVLGNFTGFLLKLFDVPVLGPAVKWVVQFGLMLAVFQKIFGATTLLRGAFNLLSGVLGKMLGFFGRFLVVAKFQGVITALRIAFFLLFNLIKAHPFIALITVAVLLIQNWDKVKAALGKLWEYVKLAFNGIWNAVKDNIGKVLAFLKFTPIGLIVRGWLAVFRWVWDHIGDGLKGALDAVVNQFRKLPGRIMSILRGAAGLVTGIGGALLGGVIDGFKSAWNSVASVINKGISIFNKLPGPDLPNVPTFGQDRPLSDRDRAAAERIPDRKASGGSVYGQDGAAVPIIAHAGEWILNKMQQRRLAAKLGEKLEVVQAWLFGTGGKEPPKGSRLLSSVPVHDGGALEEYATPRGRRREPDPGSATWGVTSPYTNDIVGEKNVYFMRLGNGTYAQIPKAHADRVRETKGRWMPSYIRRTYRGGLGGMGSGLGAMAGRFKAMASGGVVMPLQSFAAGGTVANVGAQMPVNRRGGDVHQSFEVHTASPTIDIDYIMRKSGIQAAGAF